MFLYQSCEAVQIFFEVLYLYQDTPAFFRTLSCFVPQNICAHLECQRFIAKEMMARVTLTMILSSSFSPRIHCSPLNSVIQSLINSPWSQCSLLVWPTSMAPYAAEVCWCIANTNGWCKMYRCDFLSCECGCGT